MSLYVDYAGALALAISPWPPINHGVEMDKKVKTPGKVKPERPAPAAKQARWPGQNATAGIKNAKSIHDRKPAARGSARGR